MREYRSGTALALALSLTLPGVAFAQSYKGVCTAVAGASSGKRFATVKCYKESEPGDYSIRSIVWEHQDAKAYRDMARLSGARFTCTMSRSGSKVIDDQVYDYLKFSDCHGSAPVRSQGAAESRIATPLVGPKPKTECYVCRNAGNNRALGEFSKVCLGKGQTLLSLNLSQGCRKL